MKRLALFFLLGTLVCSAQEVRIARPAILKAERSIVSLKKGTTVDLLSRDGNVLTVRFNNVIGTIPASCLVAAESPTAETQKPAEPSKQPGSRYGKIVQKAKDSAEKHDQASVQPVDEVLAVK
jgi:hypothetical protein